MHAQRAIGPPGCDGGRDLRRDTVTMDVPVAAQMTQQSPPLRHVEATPELCAVGTHVVDHRLPGNPNLGTARDPGTNLPQQRNRRCRGGIVAKPAWRVAIGCMPARELTAAGEYCDAPAMTTLRQRSDDICHRQTSADNQHMIIRPDPVERIGAPGVRDQAWILAEGAGDDFGRAGWRMAGGDDDDIGGDPRAITKRDSEPRIMAINRAGVIAVMADRDPPSYPGLPGEQFSDIAAKDGASRVGLPVRPQRLGIGSQFIAGAQPVVEGARGIWIDDHARGGDVDPVGRVLAAIRDACAECRPRLDDDDLARLRRGAGKLKGADSAAQSSADDRDPGRRLIDHDAAALGRRSPAMVSPKGPVLVPRTSRRAGPWARARSGITSSAKR